MTTLIALTRPVSDAMTECELTHLERTPIDVQRAREQHAGYCAALRDAGCMVIELPAAHDLPDSVFVEDTAIVLDEAAVITRPGAPSRRAETAAMAGELARWRPLAHLNGRATLDGGDVLRVDRTLFIGASSRTSADGVSQLRDIVAPLGYRVVAVPVSGALHLKTGITLVGGDVLLINPQWVDRELFAGLRTIDVAPDEPFAANALLVRGRVIYPSAFPRTAERLADAGVSVVSVDVAELAKAEGGVTCCSVVFAA